MVSETQTGVWESRDSVKNIRLQSLPQSRRKMTWPPIENIRQICRQYELKCAGKYEPKQNSRRGENRAKPFGHRYVFEMSREIQTQLEAIEDVVADCEDKVTFMKMEVSRLQHSPDELPTMIESTTDEKLRHQFEIQKIEQAMGNFHEALKVQSDEQLRKVKREKDDTIAQLRKDAARLRSALDRTNPQSHTVQSELKIQSLEREISRSKKEASSQLKQLQNQIAERVKQEADKLKRQHARDVTRYGRLINSRENDLTDLENKRSAQLSRMETLLRNEIEQKNELRVENNYLRGRVAELNKVVVSMQQLL